MLLMKYTINSKYEYQRHQKQMSALDAHLSGS